MMKLYCNDCGEGFLPPGDGDYYQMSNGCICPSCKHESGDCIGMENTCMKCFGEHWQHTTFHQYCWFCQRKGSHL